MKISATSIFQHGKRNRDKRQKSYPSDPPPISNVPESKKCTDAPSRIVENPTGKCDNRRKKSQQKQKPAHCENPNAIGNFFQPSQLPRGLFDGMVFGYHDIEPFSLYWRNVKNAAHLKVFPYLLKIWKAMIKDRTPIKRVAHIKMIGLARHSTIFVDIYNTPHSPKRALIAYLYTQLITKSVSKDTPQSLHLAFNADIFVFLIAWR